ncbi:jg17492 [Pararge aegeria aegeria]|uniref:Jg17492 protein n=1 Tax=Pararge aegeria aegeria TaxID=348720 RepID=A0A8S4RQA4_9NEOP|nr:jg17492 [Pararge aegeria aegeria]
MKSPYEIRTQSNLSLGNPSPPTLCTYLKLFPGTIPATVINPERVSNYAVDNIVGTQLCAQTQVHSVYHYSHSTIGHHIRASKLRSTTERGIAINRSDRLQLPIDFSLEAIDRRELR